MKEQVYVVKEVNNSDELLMRINNVADSSNTKFVGKNLEYIISSYKKVHRT